MLEEVDGPLLDFKQVRVEVVAAPGCLRVTTVLR